MKKEIIEKLRLLKRVADDSRSPTGERDAARFLFNKLLKKYHMSEVDIPQEETRKTVWYKYSHRWEEKLIGQIVAKVRENDGDDDKEEWGRKGRPVSGFDLTERQEKRVTAMYDKLRAALEEEINRCYRAFVQVNGLGLKPSKEDEEVVLSAEEEAEIMRVLRIAMLIDPTNIAQEDKLLTGGNE